MFIHSYYLKHIGVSLLSFTVGKLGVEEVAEGLVQSIIMGSYNEPYYKTKDLDTIKHLAEVTLFDPNLDPDISKRANIGKIIGEAVNYCRRLA